MKSEVIFYIEGTNYDFNGIKVTLKSLREHYSGKITVLYKDVDDRLINLVTASEAIPYDCSSFKVTFKTSPYNNKVLYSFLYLKNYSNLEGTDKVLICDISDVYFKINPFSLLSSQNKFTMFLEDKTFEFCECNSTWMEICYNSHILDLVKHKVVINAGIYLSPFNSLKEFLQLMVNEMSHVLGKINYPIVEQALVNKLIYVDNFEVILDSKNVNNMAQQIKTDINNNINHQYKVFPQIKEFLYKLYE